MPPFHVEMRSYRIVGWVTAAFGMLCAVGAFMSGDYWIGAGFFVLVLVGLYMVLGAGSFDVGNDEVTHRSAFGAWRIRWDEIVSVEVGEADGTFVLMGKDKRFVLSPPGWWASPDKEAALSFVIKEIQTRKIPARATRTAAYKIMKNTRVA